MQAPGQLLKVEQPEAQLHPTAQLELGTFFAQLWTERKVPSIVETHSPNIILRLRNLVSQGKLAASHISLAYLHVVGKAVVVKNIDINDDGSIEKGLPMEFFGADVLEAMEMSAKRSKR